MIDPVTNIQKKKSLRQYSLAHRGYPEGCKKMRE